MKRNINDIYQEIGAAIYSVTPDEWDRIQVYACIIRLDRSISIGGRYYVGDQEHFIDVLVGDNIEILDSLYFELYHLMKLTCAEGIIPWNKCRFTLFPDGEFDFQFKVDLDYKWYKSLDIDSKEFDDLDIDIIHKIKTWEGLPANFDRYWLK